MLISELADRYELKSTKAIYDRLKALDISLPKKNRKSYATPEIIDKLDSLQDHLNAGGSLKDFNEDELAITYTEVSTSDNTSLEVIGSDDTYPEVIYIQRESDPLMPNRLLAEAAEQKYLLNSRQIKEIIGVSPKGDSFSRFGFTITKVGRDGAYSSYRVEQHD